MTVLVTGGLGFIGTHTTRALLDLGEDCVATYRSPRPLPAGSAAERVDLTDQDALLSLGERHAISGVVHLAAAALGAVSPLDEIERNLRMLANVLRAAAAWGVPRVVAASTIGVYMGVDAEVLREDAPLPAEGPPHPIPAAKRCAEIVAAQAPVPVVNVRIGAIWGPGGAPRSPFFALPALVNGEPVEAYAEDGIDALYVKDCGRALALLATAPELRHSTYNVGIGRVVRNREVVDALERDVALLPGRSRPAAHLDVSRLHADTGFEPQYGLARGIEDYLSGFSKHA